MINNLVSKLNIKRETLILVALLIIVGGFIYSFNLNNRLFWDDEDWIINNPFVHSISWSNSKFWFGNNTLAGVGLKSNYYRPFLFFTFALNYFIAGVKPLLYHLTSNLIHIFNGVILFWLTLKIFKRNLIAFFISLLFLIHPLQTEAVTYISGRGDLLVAMFMLLSLSLFYSAELEKGGWLGIKKILSIFFLALGLFSRETGIIFPLIALVLYITILNPESDLGISKGRTFLYFLKQGLVKTWPYFVLVIIYGVLRLTILNFLNTLNFYLEPNIYSQSLHVRLFTFLPILWQYLKLLIVPAGLHMERGAVVYTSLFQWPVWLISVALAILVFWLRYLYRKIWRSDYRQSTIDHSQDFRVWFLGLAWFFIALGPVSGITPINALLYEHWLYFPMIGFWLIVSFYLVKLFDYLQHSQGSRSGIPTSWELCRTLRMILAVGLVGYFSFFTYQSIQRNILWGSPIDFYKDILKYEPDSSRISNNVGNLYYNQGDKDQAETYYRKAVESEDSFAQPYFNLGSILQTRGDVFGAIQLYEKAIKINPNFYYPYQNLAVIYAQQGRLTKAVESIEALKHLLPNNPRVFYNSALVYIALNNKTQALQDLGIALKYSYSDPQTGKLAQELTKELARELRK